MRQRSKIPLVVFLALAAACSSSIVPGEYDTNYDQGDDQPIIDSTDDREIPLICLSDEECDDNDPCTIDSCIIEEAVCSFSTKDIELNSFLVSTAGSALGVSVLSGRVYVAEGIDGIEVFEVVGLANNEGPVGFAETAGEAISINAYSQGVTVAEGPMGFEVFSLGMELVYGVEAGHGVVRRVSEVRDVAIGPSGYSIASCYADGIAVLDMSNMAEPQNIKYIETPGRAVRSVPLSETHGFLADSLTGAVTLEYGAQSAEEIVSKIMTQGRVVDVDVYDQTAIVAESGKGFSVVDFHDPAASERLSIVSTPTHCIAASLLGQQTAVILEQNGTVTVYDLTDASRPSPVTTWKEYPEAFDMDVNDGIIAVALGDMGVAILQTGCVDEQ